MPDELARSHVLRLRAINQTSTQAQLFKSMRPAIEGRHITHDEAPVLHLLAEAAGVSPEFYATNHSMLPVLRVASRPGTDLLHGSADSASFTRRLGMLTQSADAYCCEVCSREDLVQHGFSWFRRSHHLIGVEWCRKHATRLSRIDSREPFSKLPHRWCEEGTLVRNATEPKSLWSAPSLVQTYVDLAFQILTRDRPFPTDGLHLALASRARSIGLRLSAQGQRQLLSDKVLADAPLIWLRSHFPDISEKVISTFYSRIDNLLMPSTPAGVGHTYILALATLYSTASEALADIETQVEQSRLQYKRRTRDVRGVAFWQGEFWESYIRNLGNVAEIARELQIDPKYLREKLQALGLPSIKDLKFAPHWRAFRDFCDGMAVQTAADRHNVPVQKLEEILRTTSARLRGALRSMKFPI